MTDDRMALAELLEKGSGGDLLREMIGFMAQRLMEADVQGLVGAGPGERSETRENWRNGYRERAWHTRAGTVPLRIPNPTERMIRSHHGSGRITAGLDARAVLISGASSCLSASDGSVLPCCGWRVITQAA
jgi:hypothetical protein